LLGQVPESVRAGGQEFGRVALFDVLGEQEHPDVWPLPPDDEGGAHSLVAVSWGHPDVDDGDVGLLAVDGSEEAAAPLRGWLTWAFHIQPGIKYENGQTVTAADVKYAIERTYDRSVLANGPNYYQALLTDPKYPGPYKDKTGNLTAIDVPNPTTLVFHLRAPFADFPYVLAFPSSAPGPAECRHRGVRRWGCAGPRASRGRRRGRRSPRGCRSGRRGRRRRSRRRYRSAARRERGVRGRWVVAEEGRGGAGLGQDVPGCRVQFGQPHPWRGLVADGGAPATLFPPQSGGREGHAGMLRRAPTARS
jgi:Bacterial extracellular solute-binding proteins, family 5 Middle